MSAILAPHHSSCIQGYIADRYGNDPFVWVSPFVWSHCHARSRALNFGLGNQGPSVDGRDVAFFVSHNDETDKVVVDCVFVIADVVPISQAEMSFPVGHPVRHYHFDQERCPQHKRSQYTRIAHTTTSFIPHPPMPLDDWVDDHVAKRKMKVLDYFRLKKRRNVRVITHDAQGIYDRLVKWANMPGHQALTCLPLDTLMRINLVYPANGLIHWNPSTSSST